MTRVLRINEKNIDHNKIRYAAEQIKKGKLVVFPTETVYGIGASAFDEEACKKIFEVKHRAADNPLIVHICDFRQLQSIAAVSQNLLDKIKKVWPGPVTFVLKKKVLPDIVTAELDTAAVRMPGNKIALELIRESGVPIAAPSANISTFPSATEARHAIKDFNGRVSVIIDGGRSRFGLESTVINLSRKPYTLLRPGAYDLKDLERVFGRIIVPKKINDTKKSGKVLSPGMKYRHYSPNTRLVLFSDNDLISEAVRLAKLNKLRFALLCSEETAVNFRNERVIILGSRKDLGSIAKNLFSSLRKLDTFNVDIGFIESFDEHGIGLPIMNRLIKASVGNIVGHRGDLLKIFNSG
ncbi:MAG: L-threonylcarbamoyladenylate synthase [Candidatus Parvarchaeota archaeon]|jgi:L-threonylcarbamoyladenylate synthase|nr:L-threonylcarbamoyladenylate synthase [Candidatus Parvarchaeota archaeon]MCL5420164.1 L-threonylcarbamoyladenylate synthase [Candidatus Parvarchaeota archaeon]